LDVSVQGSDGSSGTPVKAMYFDVLMPGAGYLLLGYLVVAQKRSREKTGRTI
jgi:hypothetical protein